LDFKLPQTVREHILSMIKPTEKEIIQIKSIASQLKDAILELNEEVQFPISFISPEGSTGKKQTQLRGASDIDLFIALKMVEYPELLNMKRKERRKFSRDLFERLIDSLVLPAISKISNVTNLMKAYAEHPYVKMSIDHVEVDIVGCFDIPKEILFEYGPITAVDRSPHHTNFVVANINEKLRDDIRLFKAFTKASYSYGDKAAIGRSGFTGYSIEVMTILWNGFENLIKNLSSLERTPLDYFNRTKKELLKIEGFRDHFLIIVDPTDPKRNAGASISRRSYYWVVERILQLTELLSKSSDPMEYEQFFIYRPIPVEGVKNSPNLFSIGFRGDPSVHYTIFRDKLHHYACKLAFFLQYEHTGEIKFPDVHFEIYFENHDFSVAFYTSEPNISETYLRRGPPLKNKIAVQKFKESNMNITERGRFVWAIKKRSHTSFDEAISWYVRQNPPDFFELTSINDSSSILQLRNKYILKNCILKILQDRPDLYCQGYQKRKGRR